jgi:hypothetical protein
MSDLFVYDPTAPVADTSSKGGARFENLKGKVVGFIDNAKPNFQYLVDDLDMAERCDAVITGSGD